MGAAASLNKKANEVLPPCLVRMRALHKVRADEDRARLVLRKPPLHERPLNAPCSYTSKRSNRCNRRTPPSRAIFLLQENRTTHRVDGWHDSKVMLFYGQQDVHDVCVGPNGIGKFTRKGFGQPYVYTLKITLSFSSLLFYHVHRHTVTLRQMLHRSPSDAIAAAIQQTDLSAAPNHVEFCINPHAEMQLLNVQLDDKGKAFQQQMAVVPDNIDYATVQVGSQFKLA